MTSEQRQKKLAAFEVSHRNADIGVHPCENADIGVHRCDLVMLVQRSRHTPLQRSTAIAPSLLQRNPDFPSKAPIWENRSLAPLAVGVQDRPTVDNTRP